MRDLECVIFSKGIYVPFSFQVAILPKRTGKHDMRILYNNVDVPGNKIYLECGTLKTRHTVPYVSETSQLLTVTFGGHA